MIASHLISGEFCGGDAFSEVQDSWLAPAARRESQSRAERRGRRPSHSGDSPHFWRMVASRCGAAAAADPRKAG